MRNSKNRASGKYVLKMAVPAIAGLSAQMVVSLIDTAMVGRLEDAHYTLAAMGLGALATWAIISFFSSLSTGTHVLIARKYGAGEYSECGKVLSTSMIFTFLLGVAVAAIGMYSAYAISHFFAADKRVGDYAGDFLFYRFIGIPFFLITVSYRGFFFGIGKTKIFMYSAVLVNVLNIIFNYFLIFGSFGAPKMGLAGAGLGSSLATICDASFYMIISLLPAFKNKFHYFKHFRLDKNIVSSILNISLPVSFQNIFLMIGFLAFISIAGVIGIIEQAATQLVCSALFISIMPCFGFGIAVQTLVGNNLGSNRIALAQRYAYKTAQLATAYTLLVGVLFIFLPQYVLWMLTNDWEIIKTAVPALRIAGFSQIFYAVGIVLANGLQAAGKTLYVMLIEALSNWLIFVPLAYLFGVYLGYGLEGAWAALPFYILAYSLLIYLKFRNGDWKKLKKI
jgi:putative MATE family efflux protein